MFISYICIYPDYVLGASGLEVVEALRPKMKLSTSVDLIPNPAPALSRRMEKKNKRRAAELRAKKAAGTPNAESRNKSRINS